MMLANRFRGEDVAGWHMSEKLDGCRAFWDGKALRTRTWAEIRAPRWFTEKLPADVALDGELWLGRGTFTECRILVQYDRAAHADWHRAQFMVFDEPTTDAVCIEDRWASCRATCERAGVRFVPSVRCDGAAHAWAEMERVVAAGGEGLVLKRPGSFYAFERSRDWLKVKPAHVD